MSNNSAANPVSPLLLAFPEVNQTDFCADVLLSALQKMLLYLNIKTNIMNNGINKFSFSSNFIYSLNS